MTELLFELALRSANRTPEAPAISFRDQTISYGALARTLEAFARGVSTLGLEKLARVAVYLPKQPEAVVAMFAASRAGLAFVPVNPLLKPEQVGHILRDCNVRVLVTSPERASGLAGTLANCPDLQHTVLVGTASGPALPERIATHQWESLLESSTALPGHRLIDADIASIFYTSGSTGKPKGVVLSHRNMVCGAHSVAQYLGNVASDRLLTALPFSFDYGFSQLTTGFLTGASVVLMDYLFPREVISLVERERITGLAGVPPLWAQLADLPWPDSQRICLRYFTNSGGAMPRATLSKLRAALPHARPFLMYGLTEAFRSTYLPPEEIDRLPDSIGKAIPNAEILVLRPDGTECAVEEPGELVHRGTLVALGYWNDAEKTAERFRPLPPRDGLVLPEVAVFSGDTVRRDAEGFLYFIGRRDEMIKTSGYRVSPTEVEEVVYDSGLVRDAVALGVPHPVLGQAIVIAAASIDGSQPTQALLKICRQRLPAYMQPASILWRDSLPRNPNGKFDRKALALEHASLFAQPRPEPR